ncbi:hypothetical protein SDRG_15275 [Saprolegnia diclina VS20]|uniref:Uncharacterized protein n=1 Tax=Saprolegnia diclina (strain VS20) TaxID=1156394 RepID=T0PNF8_SAPDV|nr:hypothetical protein SDRG_15275 [Saprolegnia diclina VS20]EQC26944.1 hypothetical protein SDRG_15275 [Saprolegnia diclina VS20]|eukprot:XP_008619665.1 hypothetical protein SDRG_15275 [Saprolegnia diclina VS20]
MALQRKWVASIYEAKHAGDLELPPTRDDVVAAWTAIAEDPLPVNLYTGIGVDVACQALHALVGDAIRTTSLRAIAFWRKPYRASTLGFSSALSLAYNAVANTQRLGLSVRDLLSGILASLLRVCEYRGDRLSTEIHAITNLLIQSNDVSLRSRFLRDALPCSQMTIHDVATCVGAHHATYGWTVLFPALQSLLERWLQTHSVSDMGHFVVGLV